MKKPRMGRSYLLLSFATALAMTAMVGCGEDPPGAGGDTGVVDTDTGVGGDDSGTDGGTTGDTGVQPDGGPGADTGVTDATVDPDAGPADTGPNINNPNNDEIDSDCELIEFWRFKLGRQ